MMSQVAEKQKLGSTIKTLSPVLADSKSGKIPDRFEVLKAGNYKTLKYGEIEVTETDLQEYVHNFERGIGLASGGETGAPIDFGHENGKEAAGWIKKLEIVGQSLYAAAVEWSDVGEAAIRGKRFKCFSSEFWPKCFGAYPEVDNAESLHYNVFKGGALTNIPMFPGNKSIMASSSPDSSGGSEDKKIYLSASEKEKSMPVLEEVRVKAQDSLTEEEKSFLVEHKAELTAEEQVKFGFEQSNQETAEQKAEREAAEAKAVADKAAADKAAADAAEAARNTAPDLTNAQPIMASAVKGDEGKVVMAASEVAELYKVKRDSEVKDVTGLVKSHIARGAIKASEEKSTVDMLMGLQASARTNMETHLKNLPDNPALATENGSSEKAGDAKTATQQIQAAAQAIMASAKAEGKTMDIGTAMSQVQKENPQLAKEYQTEVTGKEQ